MARNTKTKIILVVSKKNPQSHMIGLEKMTDNSGSSEQLLREPFFPK